MSTLETTQEPIIVDTTVSLAKAHALCTKDPHLAHIAAHGITQLNKAHIHEMRIVMLRDHGLTLDEKKKDPVESAPEAEQEVDGTVAHVREKIAKTLPPPKRPYRHLMGV